MEVVLDCYVDVPEEVLKEMLKSALATIALNANFELIPLEDGENTPGELQANAETWTVPDDMHMKSAKAAHRFITAIASLCERGPAPTLEEAATKARLSMPPVYRYIDPETTPGAYIAPLVVVSKRGRVKVIDLTPLGRKVASRIRAGSLPA